MFLIILSDGAFSIKEIERIVEDMQEAKKQTRNMTRVACGLFVVLVIVAGAMFGLIFLANEVSKENKTERSVIVDLNGNPTQKKKLESFTTLSNLHRYPTSALSTIQYMSFKGVPTTSTKSPAVEFYIQVQSWQRNSLASGENYVIISAAGGHLLSKKSAAMYVQYPLSNVGSPTTCSVETTTASRLSDHITRTGEVKSFSSVEDLVAHAEEHEGRPLQNDAMVANLISFHNVGSVYTLEPEPANTQAADTCDWYSVLGKEV